MGSKASVIVDFICGGDRNESRTVSSEEIFKFTINNCLVQLVQGDITQQNVRCILNASIDPYEFRIMKHQDMPQEQLKMDIPVIQRLVPGDHLPDFIINLKVSPQISDKEKRVQAYLDSLYLLLDHELESVAFRDNPGLYDTQDVRMTNLECFMDAVFRFSHDNQSIEIFKIVNMDHNICVQYQDMMLKKSLIKEFDLFEPLNTIIEEQTDQQSTIGNNRQIWEEQQKSAKKFTKSIDDCKQVLVSRKNRASFQ